MIAFLQKAFNTFLDTTPRQWIRYWLEFWNLDFESWSDLYKTLGQNLRSLSASTICVSAIIHSILLVMAGVVSDRLYDEQKKDIVSLKDIELEGGDKTTMDIVEISGVYYFDQDFLKKKKPKSVLESLLSDLKNRGPKVASNQLQVKSPGQKKLKVSDLKKMDIDWSQITAETTEKSSDIEKELNQYLARYNDQFRNCYEKSLIKDPSLNAKVEFLLQVGSNRNIAKSEIQFSGVGTPAVKEELRGCLQLVTQKIQLPKNSEELSGKQLKFFVVLNSWK